MARLAAKACNVEVIPTAARTSKRAETAILDHSGMHGFSRSLSPPELRWRESPAET
jgi:hypothetical protein